ncbi:ATPase [Acidiplasma aeolicum]|uniref:ATPase n=2 Tax=Acidiplasma TaxID=507753 RepID=A0A0N8VKW5_9ARCH|nr:MULTISPECIES: diphthine--ammonia ligase [Acidiplasma]KPV47416.1 ATPase [Acidiplasma aeolicum]KQB34860.1 ATPase [Acidiplasma cupricumulans]KQB35758.1 ATPase [Acidiplasma aeolicum]
MRSVSLFSGGKDSFLSAMIALEQGYEIEYGITIIPEEYSMMFHYPNAENSRHAASLLGIKIKYIREEEFEDYLGSLENLALVTGAIASDYQKTRIEKNCYKNNVIVYSPLWRLDQETVINELLLRNIRAMIVSVSAEGFTQNDLGKEINNEYLQHLKDLHKKYGINIAGEGGEYESFVFGLSNKTVLPERKHMVWRNSGGYLIFE